MNNKKIFKEELNLAVEVMTARKESALNYLSLEFEGSTFVDSLNEEIKKAGMILFLLEELKKIEKEEKQMELLELLMTSTTRAEIKALEDRIGDLIYYYQPKGLNEEEVVDATC